ncbi:MAG: Lrp/AsnC family transcriptional regulator [Microbacteriaceae bacterium]
MTPRRSPMSALVGAVERPHEHVRIDGTDIAILEALAEDSRISVRRLAARVDMSAPAVAERVARLERSGVIHGYTVRLDWDRLGHEVVVYMPVTLDSGKDLEPTLRAFREIPELEELTVIAGSYDLLARFRLRDQAQLRQLLLDRVWQIPHVLRIETLLSLGDLVSGTRTSGLLRSLGGDAAGGS